MALESDGFGPAESEVAEDVDEDAVPVVYCGGDPIDFSRCDVAGEFLSGSGGGANAFGGVVADAASGPGALSRGL